MISHTNISLFLHFHTFSSFPIILILFNLISPFSYVYAIVLHSQSVTFIFPKSGHICPLGIPVVGILGAPVIQHPTVLHAHVLVFFFRTDFTSNSYWCWYHRRYPIIIFARNYGDNTSVFYWYNFIIAESKKNHDIWWSWGLVAGNSISFPSFLACLFPQSELIIEKQFSQLNNNPHEKVSFYKI